MARAPWSRTFSPGWLHLLGHPMLMCPWGLEFGWSTNGILISSVKQLYLEHVVRVFCFSSPWFWSPGGPSLVRRGRSALWGQGLCLCTCQMAPGDLERDQVSGEVVRCLERCAGVAFTCLNRPSSQFPFVWLRNQWVTLKISVVRIELLAMPVFAII